MSYSCPTGFTLSGTECTRSPGTCPTGFSGEGCSVPPTEFKGDTSSNGFDPNVYDVQCAWAGGTDPACYTCNPQFPTYNAPFYDSSWPGAIKMRCEISTAHLANQHDVSPWGHDSDTPITDAAGNIMAASIITQALSSIAPPLPDDRVPCPAGTYMNTPGPGVSDGGTPIQLVDGLLSGTCIPCQIGEYCNRGYRADMVIPCPAGFVCPTPDVMIKCTAGQMCPRGSSTTKTCGPGRYCPVESVVMEYVCPAGNFCPAGSTWYRPCNSGEHCAEGSDHPSDCPAGSYCSNPTTPPVLCPAGTYCPIRSFAPISCPAGSYCPGPGAKVATTCAPGKYCPAAAPCGDATQTAACDAAILVKVNTVTIGSTFTTSTISACSACPYNTVYKTADFRWTFMGSSTQQNCAAGFYCVTPSTQTACAAGTYSATVGATSATSCTTCPVGSTCPYTGPGTMYPLPRTSPITCATGYYCPAGSTTFTPCPDGWCCPTPTQKNQCPGGAVCPAGTINYIVPEQLAEVQSPGVETCRTVCARGGTGIPNAWNGAICVDVPSNGRDGTTFTCESVPQRNVTCQCQRSYNFGWIV